MVAISGMQPSGLTTAPINSSIGNASNTIKSDVSGNFQGLSQQKVAQEIEQKKADISQLKLQEAADQRSKGSLNSIGTTKLDSAELDTLMQNLNTELKQLQNYMKFERDRDSQNMVVFIKDSSTDELIRQIPTEEFLAISKNISQYLEMRQQLFEKLSPPVGLLTNETA